MTISCRYLFGHGPKMTGHPRKSRWPRALLFSALTLIAGLFATLPAQARGYEVRLDYSAVLNGIRVGTGDVNALIGRDGAYRVRGEAGLSGFIGGFFRYRANGVAEGEIRNDRVFPDRYVAAGEGGDNDRSVLIRFRDDRVHRTNLTPELPDDHFDSRVPFSRGHLRHVVDPVSAAIMPAPNGLTQGLCEGRIKVYTGRQAISLRLSYVGVRDVRSSRDNEFSGRVVVCGVKVRPLAGYRPGGRFHRYTQETKDIEAWIGLLGDTGYAAPVRVSFPTPFGTGIVQMTGIEINPTQRNARAE